MRRDRNADRDRLLTERLRDRFIITTVTGETFDGLLEDVDDKTVVMVNAGVMRDSGSTTPVEGELVIRRDSIAYMQKP